MDTYVRWIVETALPTWAERGYDAAAERFVERLDWSGRPLAVPHRAMVQARQVYVYAQAAALGWHADAGRMAEAAMRSLRRDFVQEHGDTASVAFAIDPATGAITSDVRDSYTHAFVLFAAAQLYALTGDPALLGLAERITAFVEREMRDPEHGGVFDVLPATPVKRQNPQMHLLEAYLSLESVAPAGGYRERADILVRLFHDRMTSQPHGVLLEHFAHDWSAHPEQDRASVFEPGHHFEWAWLLRRHERLCGGDHAAWRTTLHDHAIAHGRSSHGLLFDEVHADKRPVKTSTRLWPHTEAIKAAAVRHEEGDAAAIGFARDMAGALADHFLDKPFAGGWADHLGADLVPLVDYVPASSLYHLMLAAVEADATFCAAGPVEPAAAGDISR